MNNLIVRTTVDVPSAVYNSFERYICANGIRYLNACYYTDYAAELSRPTQSSINPHQSGMAPKDINLGRSGM